MNSYYKIRYDELIIALIILNFAIAINYFIIGEGVNIQLVVFSALLILFRLKYLFQLNKSQISLYILPFFLLFPFITNPTTFRLISFFYSLIFLAVFQIIISYLNKRKISEILYKNILKIILSAFFYIALAQSILFPLGIYFNQIWSSGNENRINSLATEPSYTGIIVVITFYSYLLLNRNENQSKYSISDFRSDLKYCMFVIVIIYLTQSGYAFVFFCLLLFSLVLKNQIIRKGIIIAILSSLFFILSFHFEVKPVIRIINLANSFISLNVNQIAAAEHSGSIRVAPVIIFLKNFNFFELESWIGHGIGYNNMLMASIIPGIDISTWRGGGFLPAFIYDYGLIPIVAFVIFLIRNTIRRINSLDTIFLFLIFLNASFNTQLFWYSIMIFTINKFFINNKIDTTNAKF